eukprot:CAMPEP_0119558440 /NCGR_PEP_ID=MMETSP1352-20130426/10791_1 /TAXON_ID=265584 /ORGANISM="Stauroneis constricta, Strain CCMP1120" /LENGTH=315 /DNA_ID=CAMNT_0007605809 /DNA_START=27 /DNA_END=974 /DNA_ORIENTATION=-
MASTTAPASAQAQRGDKPQPGNKTGNRNSSKPLFPKVLYNMLEDAAAEGFEDVVSWNSSGRSFKIHDRDRFLADVLPRYARLKQYKSFVRQLNLWGFSCVHGGRKAPERGSYQHMYFVRGRVDLCDEIATSKEKALALGSSATKKQKQATAPKKTAGATRSATLKAMRKKKAKTVAAIRQATTTVPADEAVSTIGANGENTEKENSDDNGQESNDASFLDDAQFSEYIAKHILEDIPQQPQVDSDACSKPENDDEVEHRASSAADNDDFGATFSSGDAYVLYDDEFCDLEEQELKYLMEGIDDVQISDLLNYDEV